MNSDVHARIESFLQGRNIVPLAAGSDIPPERIIKAGVVPFLRGKEYRFYLMKPIARHARLNAPAFQLCKGTRMHCPPGAAWCDMRDDEVITHKQETLPATALREGIEELGLTLDTIGQLFELGPYAFSSAKSGRERHMWLFAAEMHKEDAFLPDSEVAPTTDARKWLALAEFEVVGRDDHRYILRDIAAKLAAHYKE